MHGPSGFLDAIVRDNADVIVVIDPLGRFTFVNEAARRILGQDPEDWVGRDGFDLIHPDDRGLAAESLGSTLDEGGVREPLVLRFLHADGTWRHLELIANNLVQDERVAGLVITARDVSARRRSEASAAEARDRFEQAFDQAPIGMAMVANDGRLLRVNAALAGMLAMSLQELHGRNLIALSHPEARSAAVEHAASVLEADDDRPFETRFLRSTGETAWARVTSTVIRGPSGTPLHSIVQIEDVTEQRTLRHQLEEAATHDPLTGLLNRAGLEARYAEAAGRLGDRSALLVIDLDGFKPVNDTYGHAAGDVLLEQLARRLRGCLRADEIAARIGGDEFVVFVPGITGPADAVAVGDRIRAAIARPFRLPRGAASVTGSVGVALLQGPVELQRALLVADRASYEAKHGGGDRVELAFNAVLHGTA